MRNVLHNSSYDQSLTMKQASDTGIEIQFSLLENIVKLISDTLLQGQKATAELDRICIQSKGSSMTIYQNFLSRNGYIALLYVEATIDWNADSKSSFIIKRSE